jgi:starvation-inducible DNA-binding protein
MLSHILSNEMTLYIKTRKFHINVSDKSYIELHKLLHKQYTEQEETIDIVAGHTNKLGGKTIGTMKEFAHLARVKKSPGKYPSQREMMK